MTAYRRLAHYSFVIAKFTNIADMKRQQTAFPAIINKQLEQAMPLKQGSSQSTISNNIKELHSGNTYAHTASKFGANKANRQAVAIALSEAGKSKPPRRKVKWPTP